MKAAALALLWISSLLPTDAKAALPGSNLSWNSCAISYATGNLNFACDSNSATNHLVVSFRLAAPMPDYIGVAIRLECQVGAGSTMPWWSFTPGGCREGAIGLTPVPDGIGGCASACLGRSQAGGVIVETVGTSRWRLRADWAVDAPTALAADTRYAAMVITMSTERSFDNGSGVCEGCDRQACFSLDQVELFPMSFPPSVDASQPDVRNYVTYQNAIASDGCVTPARASTWGAIKALYR